MPYYIVPELHDSSIEIVELAQRAKVELVRVQHLYDLAQVIPAPGLVIVSIDEEHLMILMRNLATLLPETPTVVGAVPGVQYSPSWNRLSATLPDIDYMELSGKLAKSGLLASSTEDASNRTIGNDRRTASFASQFVDNPTKSNDDNPAEDDFESEV